MSNPKLKQVEGGVTAPLEGLPQTYGDYLLLHRLGRGGMGEVFLAKSGGLEGIHKLCVVKTLRTDLTRDQEYIGRFMDEARVVVQLNHRNICHVFDVGRVDDSFYLAMEHIAGRDLRTVLKRANELGLEIPTDVLLHLYSEILDALDYAHRLTDPETGAPLRLVHRDVSPQNVMVSFEGEVKLIDFGLAQSTLKLERTAPRIVMGKLAYMAPEQARGDEVDGRVDQFAAAVMCYEGLARESYYQGLSVDEVWQLAGRGGFTPRRFADIDRDAARVLQRALHPDPAQRFPTCADLQQELRRLNLARGSMASARDLREIMSRLFADDLHRDRSLVSGLAKVTPLEPRARGGGAPEHTVRIATAQLLPDSEATLVQAEMPPLGMGSLREESSGGQVFADTPPAQVKDGEGISESTRAALEAFERTQRVRAASGGAAPSPGERTEVVHRALSLEAPPSSRRGVWIAAVVALVVIVGGALVVAFGGDEEPAPAALVTTRVDPVAVDPVAVDPVAVDPVPAAAVAKEEPAAAVAKEEPSTDDDDDARAAPKRTSTRRRDRASKRVRSVAEKSAPPDVPLSSPPQKVDYLKRHCLARVSCAERVVQDQRRAVADPDPVVFASWLKRLDRCVKTCQR